MSWAPKSHYDTCALGWARKDKSARIKALALAHMPMGMGSHHTDFGEIWSSQLVAARRFLNWKGPSYGKILKIFVLPEIEILLCK